MKFGTFVVNAVCYVPNLILGLVDLTKVGLEVVNDSKYSRGYDAGYADAVRKHQA